MIVIYLPSFLILSPLFSHWIWLEVLFIFSKNQLLVSLIFSTKSLFHLFLLCYYFLPFTSFVLSSSFSAPLGIRLGWDFYFLRQICVIVNFPLRTAFAVPPKVWITAFSFVSRYFKIFLFGIFEPFIGCSVSCWLASCVCVLPGFFLITAF